MINTIKSIFGVGKGSMKEGDQGIEKHGYRRYVGGHWEEIGQLQFDFLIKQGLKPSDILVDIACGSLRAGVHFIPYLDKGNYLGIEKEKTLVRLGLEKELGPELEESKAPEFVISDSFEFDKLSKTPNMAIAQSLFTHLPPALINTCMQNLLTNFDSEGVFYATYVFSKKTQDNGERSHDHDVFKYTPEEVVQFGESNGWKAEVIGNWGHPRNQQMVMYRPK